MNLALKNIFTDKTLYFFQSYDFEINQNHVCMCFCLIMVNTCHIKNAALLFVLHLKFRRVQSI